MLLPHIRRRAHSALAALKSMLGWSQQICKPDQPIGSLQGHTDLLKNAQNLLLKHRDTMGNRALLAREDRLERLCRLRRDIYVTDNIVSREDFEERRARWATLLIEEKAVDTVEDGNVPDLQKSASKWTPEMLARYIPEFNVRAWGNNAGTIAAGLPTEDIREFIASKTSPDLTLASADMDSMLEGSDRADLVSFRTRVRQGVDEALASHGSTNCFSDIRECSEMFSRQLIDAVLLPLCHQTSLRLVLEEKLGTDPSAVTGIADYVIVSESVLTKRARRRQVPILAVVEAKRCSPYWAKFLSQAAAQAIIQLVSLATTTEQGLLGRLAFVSDGRRWIAFEMTDQSLTFLMWPSSSSGRDTGTAVLDLAVDGSLEVLCQCLWQRFGNTSVE